MDDMPNQDISLMIGDFNAQIGNNSIGWEGVLGTAAEGIQTYNDEWLLNLCGSNIVKIGHVCIFER